MNKIILTVLLFMLLLPAAQGYECWKGNMSKEGQYGTVEKDGYVPDSERVACTEYQAWTDAQPTPIPTVLYEEKLVATTGLDPTTQAAISAITGAGAAYLVVRRKKA